MKRILYFLVMLNLVFLICLQFRQAKVHEPRSNSVEESSIQLLKEREVRLARQLEAEHIFENPILGVGGREAFACQSVGPFEHIDSAQDIAERLDGLGFQVKLRAVDEVTTLFDYRVLIPPAASVQEAYRRLRELKSQGIDGYVLSHGENSLGISLGVFPSKQAAIDHRRKLTEEGYGTKIREISRFDRGYWVFADRGVRLPSEEIRLATSVHMGAELIERACLH